MPALVDKAARFLSGIALDIDPAEVLRFQGYRAGAAPPGPDVVLLFEEALALARELRHPQSLIYALHATCCVRQYRRETDSVGEAAQALVELASEYGLAAELGLK